MYKKRDATSVFGLSKYQVYYLRKKVRRVSLVFVVVVARYVDAVALHVCDVTRFSLYVSVSAFVVSRRHVPSR